VLRADFGAIEVGARTSVQDGTVVHAGADCPTIIGRDCVIGHNVHVEGCTVEDEVLVGSNSTVLPYCVLGRGSVVGASALLTKGTTVPARAIALGVPAEITLDAIDEGRWSAGVQRYVDLAARYANEMTAIPQPPA
jgi:carbonic anhydrase/acetyltransferase-like protein (isoleucine patch superfamily)